MSLSTLQKDIFLCTLSKTIMEGWQSGQMQRTVNPSTYVYESSNLSPSTIISQGKRLKIRLGIAGVAQW